MDAITKATTGWLTTCLEKHSRCPRNDAPESYPTRLLELGELTIRLVRPAEGDITGPYAALSYCWGPNPQFIRLTRFTQDDLHRGIPISHLPIAFQEAIHLLKSFSVRLLWIDALCIVQDSDEDWLRESAKMYQVYDECHLSLSLSRSASPAES
ncbi:heterokaryon incompatibility protein-domain-containing protein, partial [Immersiella caudata]